MGEKEGQGGKEWDGKIRLRGGEGKGEEKVKGRRR